MLLPIRTSFELTRGVLESTADAVPVRAGQVTAAVQRGTPCTIWRATVVASRSGQCACGVVLDCWSLLWQRRDACSTTTSRLRCRRCGGGPAGRAPEARTPFSQWRTHIPLCCCRVMILAVLSQWYTCAGSVPQPRGCVPWRCKVYSYKRAPPPRRERLLPCGYLNDAVWRRVVTRGRLWDGSSGVRDRRVLSALSRWASLWSTGRDVGVATGFVIVKSEPQSYPRARRSSAGLTNRCRVVPLRPRRWF